MSHPDNERRMFVCVTNWAITHDGHEGESLMFVNQKAGNHE